MKLKIKSFRIKAGKPVAFIHARDAARLDIHPGERIKIRYKKKADTAIIDTVKGFLSAGEIALSEKIISSLNINVKDSVDIEPSKKPESARIIQSKIKCEKYTKPELKKIILDIVNNNLKEAEIAYFVSGVNHCGMTLEETKFLTEAIFETGKRMKWKSKCVADKHSIGGIPGNRTTPIVVSICASAGVIMPKTSSKAITTASGTADTIGAIAKVDFSLPQLRKIVRKTGACLVWGGSLGLAPADDKIIQIEKVLNLDPEPQLLASILSKKLAGGAKFVLIDIPYGPGAKVSKKQALNLRTKFQKLAKELGLKIKVILTDGSQPIGNAIGPILEIKDILRVLKRDNSPKDLEKKSLLLAGEILEMVGKARKGQGINLAKKILDSGRAFKKFEEIIKAQSGSINGNLRAANFQHTIRAKRNGRIANLDNKGLNYLARLAGSPVDKSAGLYLYKHKNERLKKGDKILTIYSKSKNRLNEAKNFFKKTKPIILK